MQYSLHNKLIFFHKVFQLVFDIHIKIQLNSNLRRKVSHSSVKCSLTNITSYLKLEFEISN